MTGTEVPNIPNNQIGIQNVIPSSNVTNSNTQIEGATPEPEGAGVTVDTSQKGVTKHNAAAQTWTSSPVSSFKTTEDLKNQREASHI